MSLFTINDCLLGKARETEKNRSEALTNVSCLLRILVVRQVVAWYKDGHSATIL